MKEDSKRLLRGMTEVSDQYILEAEAFYQKKDEQNVDRENAVKEIKEITPSVSSKCHFFFVLPTPGQFFSYVWVGVSI